MKRVKQRIKCFECGKKTTQQVPEKYQQSFYCKNCDIMWSVIPKPNTIMFNGNDRLLESIPTSLNKGNEK